MHRPDRANAPPLCKVNDIVRRFTSNIYPTQAIEDGRVGAVAIRFSVDEAGVLSNPLVITGAGSDFAANLLKAVHNWHVVWKDADGCRKQTDDFVISVNFAFE